MVCPSCYTFASRFHSRCNIREETKRSHTMNVAPDTRSLLSVTRWWMVSVRLCLVVTVVRDMATSACPQFALSETSLFDARRWCSVPGQLSIYTMVREFR